MSLFTDKIFVRALRSNNSLMALLPGGDVYNTTIACPDEDVINADVPYIIVSFNGMTNGDNTKDDIYEGDTDTVTIGVLVAAKDRPTLATIAQAVRDTIRDFFEELEDDDADYDLVPFSYNLSAGAVNYDSRKPCYWQSLTYQCETNPD